MTDILFPKRYKVAQTMDANPAMLADSVGMWVQVEDFWKLKNENIRLNDKLNAVMEVLEA